MQYLKVWTSFRDIIKPLSDAEKGRLFDMMLHYAETGEEPGDFAGNERFIWPAAKQSIDLMAVKAETLRQNGLKGGRPVSKDNQTKPSETKVNQSEPNKSLNNNSNSNNKNNNKVNKDITDRFDRFWAAYPRHTAKQTALNSFIKVNPDEELLAVMLKAITEQKCSDQWSRDNGQFIPHPSTWLNQRRWEDEVRTGKTVKAQDYEQRDYQGVQDDIIKAQNERIMRRLQEVG